MATKRRAAKKKVSVDWSDEDSVLAAMAVALECDPGDLTIEEDKSMSSFREGTIYRVERGREEYYVAESDSVAHDLAVAIVKQDLEEEPGNFEPNFIESHIDLDRLRRDLHSDVHSSIYDSLKEDADRRPMDFFKDNNIDIPEPTAKQLRDHAEAMSDDDNSVDDILAKLAEGDAEDRWIELGEDPEVPDSEIDRIADESADEQLKDPVAYLTDMLGQEDGTKKAIEIGGIDVDAAADEAVSTDGEGHFLSSYDGSVYDGPGGIVWWRHN